MVSVQISHNLQFLRETQQYLIFFVLAGYQNNFCEKPPIFQGVGEVLGALAPKRTGPAQPKSKATIFPSF